MPSMQFKPLLQLISPKGAAMKNEPNQHIEVMFKYCNVLFHLSAEISGIDLNNIFLTREAKVLCL